jgi:CHAD domain-containing protein
MKDRTFAIPADFDVEALRRALAGRLDPRREGGATEQFTYCDSYDWGLYRGGLTLACNGAGFHLERLGDGGGVARAGVATGPAPRFARDFPPGALRDRLARRLKVRALLRLVTIRRDWEAARLVNDAGRTVVRARWERATLSGKDGGDETVARLVLQPVRGFAREFREVCRGLRRGGLEPTATPFFEAILDRAGITPGAYSAKIDLQLDPQLPAREATRIICRSLVRTMRHNEAGIVRDIDSEFLHDFRVAVRRTRSALAMFKGVFPAPESERMRDDFAYFGRLTGRLRDFDVYLLKQDAYTALSPPELRPGVAELFANLARRRRREHERVCAGLAGRRYREAMARWGRFLTPAVCARCGPSPRADLPLRDLAAATIGKYHRRVLKRGRKINAASPDADLHRLRIDGKKLRYLLEFFASVYGADEVAVPVKQLKRLQDNLGDYNDLALQIASLGALLVEPDETDVSPVLHAAVGGLITRLYGRKRRVRKAFDASFATFAKDGTTARFARLSARR